MEICYLRSRELTSACEDADPAGTGAVLRALASEASFVKVVILSRRVEDAAALSAGLEYAVGDVIVTLRGDLTSAPHDVSTLLNALLSGEGAGRGGKRPDLVCGWRRDSTLTFRQKVVSKVASWLMAGVTQVPVACIPYGLCTSAPLSSEPLSSEPLLFVVCGCRVAFGSSAAGPRPSMPLSWRPLCLPSHPRSQPWREQQ